MIQLLLFVDCPTNLLKIIKKNDKLVASDESDVNDFNNHLQD